MMTVSIRDIPVLDVAGETPGKIFHGFDQEWYPTLWQRRSGCGPTVAAETAFYYTRSRAADPPAGPASHGEALEQMLQAWRHVTPTARGIPSAALLRDDFAQYAGAAGLPLEPECLDIPARRDERPALSQLVQFVAQPLGEDMPVAFLNLHNGSEAQLDSWHWVLIVGLSYEPEGTAAVASILDEGVRKTVDLGLWLDSTKLGGGLVRFRLRK